MAQAHDKRATMDKAEIPSPAIDGRHSPAAAAILRGVVRMLRQHGFCCVSELALSTGHRADVVAVGRTGEIWIVEIKSSIEDFRADNKWPAYRDHCDRLLFAVARDFPAPVLPDDAGLIIADRYGGELLREAPEHKLSGARRKAVMLRVVHHAAGRLQTLLDPDARS